MNIVFCDDNELILDHLIKSVKSLIREYNVYNFEFNYFRYKDPLALISDLEKIRFDIAFLDIEIPEFDGLTIGDRIYNSNEDVKIFYVTNYENYLADSIKHKVYRFVKKGDISELQDGIKNMLTDLSIRHSRYKFVYKNRCYSIPLSSIFYFEKSRNNVKIITNSDIFLQRITIKELITTLPKLFCRCHAGFIVNLSKVKEISDNSVILNNDAVLPVSKKYHADLIFSLNEDF